MKKLSPGEKEHDGGGDGVADDEIDIGLDGGRLSRSLKMAMRNTLPSTGGIQPAYRLSGDGADEERARPHHLMSWNPI